MSNKITKVSGFPTNYKRGDIIIFNNGKTYIADNSLNWIELSKDFIPNKGLILQNTNLNNLLTTGIYFQNINAYATTSLNYPQNTAGILEVFNNDNTNDNIFQRYTVLSGQTNENSIFVRGRYANAWSPWKNTNSLNSSQITFVNNLMTNSSSNANNIVTTTHINNNFISLFNDNLNIRGIKQFKNTTNDSLLSLSNKGIELTNENWTNFNSKKFEIKNENTEINTIFKFNGLNFIKFNENKIKIGDSNPINIEFNPLNIQNGGIHTLTIDANGRIFKQPFLPISNYTETDPTVPAHVKSITTTEKNSWNQLVTNYKRWGNNGSDTRIIKPNMLPGRSINFGFMHFNNTSGACADYLHFNSYSDSTGGKQNLLVLDKTNPNIRLYQGDWNSSNNYSTFVDVWHTGNFNPNNYATVNHTHSNYLTSETDTLQTVTNRGNTTTNTLTVTNTSSVAGALGVKATNSKLILSVSNTYGLDFWTQSNGHSYIQNKRFDGNTTTYPLHLQPQGNIVTIAENNPTNNDALTVKGRIKSIGLDSNWVNTYITNGSINSIVSGIEYKYHSSTWIVGNRRNNSTSSLGYSFVHNNEEIAILSPSANLEFKKGNSNIIMKQLPTSNAIGLTWNKTDGSTLVQIGTHTTGNNLNGMYMGWKEGTNEPWVKNNNFYVSPTELKYKNQDIIHTGNVASYIGNVDVSNKSDVQNTPELINNASRNISSQNLNDFRKGGFYCGNNLINAPNTAWYYLTVENHHNSNTFVKQTLTAYGHDIGHGTYIRTKKNTEGWTPWEKLITNINQQYVNNWSVVSNDNISFNSPTFNINRRYHKFNNNVYLSDIKNTSNYSSISLSIGGLNHGFNWINNKLSYYENNLFKYNLSDVVTYSYLTTQLNTKANTNLQNIESNLSQNQKNIIKQRIGIVSTTVINALNQTTQSQYITLTNTTFPRLERIWYGGTTNGWLEITKTNPVDGDEIIVHGKQCVVVMINHKVYSPRNRTSVNSVDVVNHSNNGNNTVLCVHLRFSQNLNCWVCISATAIPV